MVKNDTMSSEKDDVICLKKDYYDDLRKRLKEQNHEIDQLRKILDDGKVSRTVEVIEECRIYIFKKAPIIFLQLSLYPLGKAERISFIKLLDTLSDFIEMGRSFFLNNEKRR